MTHSRYLQQHGVFHYERSTVAAPTVGSEHYHDFFELYFLEKGTCRYFIDNRSFEVAPGDLVLIPAGTIHKTLYRPGVRTRELIYCSAAYIPEALGDLPVHLPLYRNPRISGDIGELFARIGTEFCAAMPPKKDPIACEMLTELTRLLFYLLIRHREECPCVQGGNPLVTDVINDLKQHLAMDIRLPQLAHRHGVSPAHLSRLFKKETGFGLWEYLRTLRLQRAAHLLRQVPPRSVAEIAFSCGFNDSNYFSEQFKKAFGCPPGIYRRRGPQ